MKKKAPQRTPPPGVHSHLPVTPLKINSEGEGPRAGGGASNFSLNNPWGAHLGASHPPRAPGQPPQPPPPVDQMQGVPAPAQPQATPGMASIKKLISPGRRPRTGDEDSGETA